MGVITSKLYLEGHQPKNLPPSDVTPTFDPQLGFKAPRKPRVSKLSPEEMKALNIPRKYRDYCAHLYVELNMCEEKYLPLFGLCNPERRAYKHCEEEDVILRQKEYEREKRLRIREAKKQGKDIS